MSNSESLDTMTLTEADEVVSTNDASPSPETTLQGLRWRLQEYSQSQWQLTFRVPVEAED